MRCGDYIKIDYLNYFQMLKTIAFKMFVHFKDKTVISLDVPTEGQTGNSNEDGKAKSRSNFLNIFVGANFSGKSAVLELIRRCMTESINTSVTSSWDDNLVAYAFCKFDMDLDQKIISGIIKDPNTDKKFKISFSSDKLYIIVYSRSPNLIDFYECKNSLDANISTIFTKEDKDAEISRVLQKIKKACQDGRKVFKKDNDPTWGLWDSIEHKYVAMFPLRGIGRL